MLVLEVEHKLGLLEELEFLGVGCTLAQRLYGTFDLNTVNGVVVLDKTLIDLAKGPAPKELGQRDLGAFDLRDHLEICIGYDLELEEIYILYIHEHLKDVELTQNTMIVN